VGQASDLSGHGRTKNAGVSRKSDQNPAWVKYCKTVDQADHTRLLRAAIDELTKSLDDSTKTAVLDSMPEPNNHRSVPTTLEEIFGPVLKKIPELRATISAFQADYTNAIASEDPQKLEELDAPTRFDSLTSELNAVKEALTHARRQDLSTAISSRKAGKAKAVAFDKRPQVDPQALFQALTDELSAVKETLTRARRTIGLEAPQSPNSTLALTDYRLRKQQKLFEGKEADWRDVFKKSHRYERNPGPGKKW
jgi:hypothetical protein